MSRPPVELQRRRLLVLGSSATLAACAANPDTMFVSPRPVDAGSPPPPEDAAVDREAPKEPFLELDGGIADPGNGGRTLVGGGVDVGAVSEFAVGSWRLNAGVRAVVARDARGFFAYSAICTHERCLLGEPDAMGVTECACHASRFDGNGAVLRGPAVAPLAHVAVTILGERVLVNPSMRVEASLRTALPDPDAGVDGGADAMSDVARPDASDGAADAAVDVRDAAVDARDAAVDVDPCTRGGDVGAVTAFALNTWTSVRAMGIIVGRDSGGLYAFSALCTHSGCVVTVNSDGTSDCPCHNSRFDANGRVTRGPASSDLQHYAVLVCAGRVRVDQGAVVAATTRTAVS